jgi:hypothetical protein
MGYCSEGVAFADGLLDYWMNGGMVEWLNCWIVALLSGNLQHFSSKKQILPR